MSRTGTVRIGCSLFRLSRQDFVWNVQVWHKAKRRRASSKVAWLTHACWTNRYCPDALQLCNRCLLIIRSITSLSTVVQTWMDPSCSVAPQAPGGDVSWRRSVWDVWWMNDLGYWWIFPDMWETWESVMLLYPVSLLQWLHFHSTLQVSTSLISFSQ